MEFPVEYPQSAYQPNGQNAKGHAKLPGGGKMDPGHSRTVTDQKGKIQGVMYHPKGDPQQLVRADEHYRKGKVRRF